MSNLVRLDYVHEDSVTRFEARGQAKTGIPAEELRQHLCASVFANNIWYYSKKYQQEELVDGCSMITKMNRLARRLYKRDLRRGSCTS